METGLLISDAAKEVQVESHVLRYWEEELQLPIKRNELGHRFYTEEDVERFKQIKNMKERGLQLKAIKMILKDGKFDVLPQEASIAGIRPPEKEDHPVVKKPDGHVDSRAESREEKAQRLQWIMQQLIRQAVRENNAELVQQVKVGVLQQISGEIADQINAGMTQQISAGVAQQLNAGLTQQISAGVAQQLNAGLIQQIRESVLKELDYQFRMQEEREEERAKETIERTEYYYQQMDELLRKKSGRKKIGGKTVHAGINMELLKDAAESGGEAPNDTAKNEFAKSGASAIDTKKEKKKRHFIF